MIPEWVKLVVPPISAFLAGWWVVHMNQKFEPHKLLHAFAAKKKEIIFNKLFDKQLEALEELSDLLLRIGLTVATYKQHIVDNDASRFEDDKAKLHEHIQEINRFGAKRCMYIHEHLSEAIILYHTGLTRLVELPSDRSRAATDLNGLTEVYSLILGHIRMQTKEDPTRFAETLSFM